MLAMYRCTQNAHKTNTFPDCVITAGIFAGIMVTLSPGRECERSVFGSVCYSVCPRP